MSHNIIFFGENTNLNSLQLVFLILVEFLILLFKNLKLGDKQK